MTSSVAQSQAKGTIEFDDVMWTKAVNLVSDEAYSKLPATLKERITRATALAMQRQAIRYVGEGVWMVHGSTGTHQVDAKLCTCEDFTRAQAPEGYCKHRLGVMMVRRVLKMHPEDLEHTPETVLGDSEEASELTAPEDEETTELHTRTGVVRVPRSQVEYLKGNKQPFIKFTGLLMLAHERGLISLDADWTLNEEKLSLARAVAVFPDNKVFKECGDSTPSNAQRVGEHWRRMSLTRAKARCLRDALGISAVAVEEMD